VLDLLFPDRVWYLYGSDLSRAKRGEAGRGAKRRTTCG